MVDLVKPFFWSTARRGKAAGKRDKHESGLRALGESERVLRNILALKKETSQLDIEWRSV
jgi:hypothetical protein